MPEQRDRNLDLIRQNGAFDVIVQRDVTLAGVNYPSANPLASQSGRVLTGAFVAFGTETKPGQVIKGGMPCSGAVFKLVADTPRRGRHACIHR